MIFPGVCAKRSQMASPLRFSFQPPSFWKAAVAVPQKNPLGKEISEGASNWRTGVLVEIAELALEAPPPHAEKTAGRLAAALALRIDCTNLRRVRGKLDFISFRGRGKLESSPHE